MEEYNKLREELEADKKKAMDILHPDYVQLLKDEDRNTNCKFTGTSEERSCLDRGLAKFAQCSRCDGCGEKHSMSCLKEDSL